MNDTTTRSEKELKAEAERLMRENGHEPSRFWETYGYEGAFLWDSTCETCGKYVRISQRTERITGTALSMKCGEREQQEVVTQEIYDVLRGWLNQGDVIGVFRNQAFDSASFGHVTFLRLSPDDEVPERMPDTKTVIGWKYMHERILQTTDELDWFVTVRKEPALKITGQPPGEWHPSREDFPKEAIEYAKNISVHVGETKLAWAYVFRKWYPVVTSKKYIFVLTDADKFNKTRRGRYFRAGNDAAKEVMGEDDWYVGYWMEEGGKEPPYVGVVRWESDEPIDKYDRKKRERSRLFLFPLEGEDE